MFAMTVLFSLPDNHLFVWSMISQVFWLIPIFRFEVMTYDSNWCWIHTHLWAHSFYSLFMTIANRISFITIEAQNCFLRFMKTINMNFVFHSLSKSRNESTGRSTYKSQHALFQSTFGVAPHVVAATFGHIFSLNN